jgi:hypothetical protein
MNNEVMGAEPVFGVIIGCGRVVVAESDLYRVDCMMYDLFWKISVKGKLTCASATRNSRMPWSGLSK